MGPEQGKSSGRVATFSLWTGLFSDGISSTEDNLQKAAHVLNQIITEYGLIICARKVKSMVPKGQDPLTLQRGGI